RHRARGPAGTERPRKYRGPWLPRRFRFQSRGRARCRRGETGETVHRVNLYWRISRVVCSASAWLASREKMFANRHGVWLVLDAAMKILPLILAAGMLGICAPAR